MPSASAPTAARKNPRAFIRWRTANRRSDHTSLMSRSLTEPLVRAASTRPGGNPPMFVNSLRILAFGAAAMFEDGMSTSALGQTLDLAADSHRLLEPGRLRSPLLEQADVVHSACMRTGLRDELHREHSLGGED